MWLHLSCDPISEHLQDTERDSLVKTIDFGTMVDGHNCWELGFQLSNAPNCPNHPDGWWTVNCMELYYVNCVEFLWEMASLKVCLAFQCQLLLLNSINMLLKGQHFAS